MKIRATSAQKEKGRRERWIEIGCTLHQIKVLVELREI